MKKPFWRKFLITRRNRKKKPNTSLTVRPAPKPHKTEPDRWTPPFAANKETPPIKVDSQDMVILNETSGLQLDNVKISMGVMLQVELNYTFQFFIEECLKRFKNLDWGGVNEKEKRLNELRITAQTGIVYGIYTELVSGVQIWVVADLDQGITRVCLSDELQKRC